MKLTPGQRRFRIYRIAEGDEAYQKAKEQLDIAQTKFTHFSDRLPRFLRNFLWTYPGMQYFTHHRLLDVICDCMVFPDEQE